MPLVATLTALSNATVMLVTPETVSLVPMSTNAPSARFEMTWKVFAM